jgi:ketosteroid isomerase-like protein
VEESEEIRRVVERWTRAMAEGDKECLERLSEHDGTLIVGTDPAEWWRGRETRAVWGRQIEELRGVFSGSSTATGRSCRCTGHSRGRRSRPSGDR